MQTTMKVVWRDADNNGGLGTETNNQSLDQYIASFIGGDTTFPSLELGVQPLRGRNSQTRMCFAGPSQYVTPDDNPSNVYQRMFGDALLSVVKPPNAENESKS